jgi:hypothetical protein
MEPAEEQPLLDGFLTVDYVAQTAESGPPDRLKRDSEQSVLALDASMSAAPT